MPSIFKKSPKRSGPQCTKEKPRTPSPDEFLERFRERGSKCLENTYLANHDIVTSSNTEILSTTLPGDVFSLVNVQIDIVHEYLKMTKMAKSEVGAKLLIECLIYIISSLRELQEKHRDCFLLDMESSCAAANDFMRMIECFDELMEDNQKRYPHLQKMKGRRDEGIELMEKNYADLIAMYGNDAVFAVQRSQIFVMQNIQSSRIPEDLFSVDWEDSFVYNEVAISIVKTMEDFLYDFHDYLSSDFLYCKVASVLIPAIVCFYIRCLVQKADNIRRRKRKVAGFQNPQRAVLRMMYDIQVFETYFSTLVKQIPALSQIVQKELSALVIVYECLNIIVDEKTTSSTLQDHILVLHKRTGAYGYVTRFLIKDLWLLGSPKRSHKVLNETIRFMQNELQLLSMKIEEGEKLNSIPKQQKEFIPGLRLKEVLGEIYEHRITQEKMMPCVRIVKNPKLRVKPVPEPVSPTSASSLNYDFTGENYVTNSPTSVLDSTYASTSLPSFPEIPQGERTLEDHRGTIKALNQKIFDVLKLHNIRFITKMKLNSKFK